jgi:hypothetical protein
VAITDEFVATAEPAAEAVDEDHAPGLREPGERLAAPLPVGVPLQQIKAGLGVAGEKTMEFGYQEGTGEGFLLPDGLVEGSLEGEEVASQDDGADTALRGERQEIPVELGDAVEIGGIEDSHGGTGSGADG